MPRAAHVPLLLAVALGVVACGDRTAPESAPLAPGALRDGLRLSARLDVQHGLIRYEVENVGTHPITYARGHLGPVLEVRRAGDAAWIEPAVRADQIYFVSGMGPLPRDVRSLAPGCTLPADAFHSVVAQSRFDSRGEARKGLQVPPADEALLLDLLLYVWPASLGDLEEGVLELRVVQVFPDWSELLNPPVHAGRVASGTLRLELADVPTTVRAALTRAGRD